VFWFEEAVTAGLDKDNVLCCQSINWFLLGGYRMVQSGVGRVSGACRLNRFDPVGS